MSEYVVVMTEEMTTPTANGETTVAHMCAIVLSEKIKRAGIGCRLVVERRPGAYPEGSWLRAIADRDDSMNDVLLAGMIGKGPRMDKSIDDRGRAVPRAGRDEGAYPSGNRSRGDCGWPVSPQVSSPMLG